MRYTSGEWVTMRVTDLTAGDWVQFPPSQFVCIVRHVVDHGEQTCKPIELSIRYQSPVGVSVQSDSYDADELVLVWTP